jgi:hypothetical protein
MSSGICDLNVGASMRVRVFASGTSPAPTWALVFAPGTSPAST